MLAFKVTDMTCGHCASAITRAVSAVDPRARVDIDLARQRVTVEPVDADAAALRAAIAAAGYTAEPVPANAAAPPPARAAGGCGCGPRPHAA